MCEKFDEIVINGKSIKVVGEVLDDKIDNVKFIEYDDKTAVELQVALDLSFPKPGEVISYRNNGKEVACHALHEPNKDIGFEIY